MNVVPTIPPYFAVSPVKSSLEEVVHGRVGFGREIAAHHVRHVVKNSGLCAYGERLPSARRIRRIPHLVGST